MAKAANANAPKATSKIRWSIGSPERVETRVINEIIWCSIAFDGFLNEALHLYLETVESNFTSILGIFFIFSIIYTTENAFMKEPRTVHERVLAN